MSIASEISALSGHLADAYTKIDDKGGTLPANQTMKNLSDAIDSIPSGGGGGAVESVTINNKSTFTDGITIGSNGLYIEEPLNITVLPATAPQLVTVISSDATVVKPVYNNGAYSLRCIKAGTVTIRVQDYTGTVADTMTFTVDCVVSAFSISRKLPVFPEVGSTYQLETSFTPLAASGNAITWTSSDTSIMTVDNNGLVTFVATGTAIITATVADYPTYSATTSGIVVAYEGDTDFDTMSTLIQAGTAEQLFPVGTTFDLDYSENGGTTVYTMPIIIMDYRDVELEGGVTKKGMVVRPKYAVYGSRISRAVSITDLTSSSGETVAQEGYYYYDSSNNPLNYAAGDTLDFATYPTIRKTDKNVSSSSALSRLINQGDGRWEFSEAREWLNNTYFGRYGSTFTSHLGKVKVLTVDDTFCWNGDVRTTYDYFYTPSRGELLGGTDFGTEYSQTQFDNEGAALQYYINVAGTDVPAINDTAQNNARLLQSLSQQSTNVSYVMRTVYLQYALFPGVYNNGRCAGTNYNGNSSTYYAPLAVLI